MKRKNRHNVNRKEKQTNEQILYNPRHIVQAALHDVVVACDEGGREVMTEGDEAGDVGVARVFCGLAKFNQHLDHVFLWKPPKVSAIRERNTPPCFFTCASYLVMLRLARWREA